MIVSLLGLLVHIWFMELSLARRRAKEQKKKKEEESEPSADSDAHLAMMLAIQVTGKLGRKTRKQAGRRAENELLNLNG